MSRDGAVVPLEELLVHRVWVRALAVALCDDENEADDVEQQTWLAALCRPPVDRAATRGWFRTVARNATYRRRRSRERMRRRELHVARPEPLGGDPAELAARAELHARVAAAVVALREPYRQTILLRYFEGLSMADVAAQMEAPFETVRARLRRARALLRTRLEGEDTDGRPLAVTLLPLMREEITRTGSGAAAAVATGGALMGKATMAAVVLVVGGGAAWWWAATHDDGGARQDVADAAAQPGTDEVGPAEPATETADTPRVRNRVQPRAADGADAADAPDPTEEKTLSVPELLDSRKMDLDVEGVGGLDLLAHFSAVTDVPVHVDERAMEALKGSSIHLRLSEAVLARDALQLILRLQGFGAVVEEERVVIHRAAETWETGGATVVIEPKSLDPDAPTALIVRGRVLDAAGSPVADSRLRHGTRDVGTSRSDGAFEVALKKSFQWLTARVPGMQDSPRFRVTGAYGDELTAELVLGPAAGGVRVTVATDAAAESAVARVTLSWVAEHDQVRAVNGREVPRRVGERVRVGDDGVALHECVAPGDVVVDVSAKGHVPERRTVTVVAGETTEITVRLRAATILERLRDERISFVFDEARLVDVVDYIRSTRRLNVVFDASAVSVAHVPISLTVKDDTIEGALRALCDAAGGGLDWEIKGSVVVIRRRDGR